VQGGVDYICVILFDYDVLYNLCMYMKGICVCGMARGDKVGWVGCILMLSVDALLHVQDNTLFFLSHLFRHLFPPPVPCPVTLLYC
jgi:hypothetical protein